MRLERNEEGYLYEYALNQSYFLEISKQVEDYLTADLIEMPCHVGFVDKEIMEISRLNMQRIEDYALVNSQEFKDIYQRRGYQLISFDKIDRKIK